MAQRKSLDERLRQLNVDHVRQISIGNPKEELLAETTSKRSRKRSGNCFAKIVYKIK